MSNHVEFSAELRIQIESELERHLQSEVSPHYAAFDADGTLWEVDAGETFFKYQMEHSNLKGLPTDPWNHYQEWKEKDPMAAYLWLAQINKGATLSQVRRWGHECLKKQSHWPVFEAQKQLIQWMRSRGVRVYVVTASIKWAVEPFAQLLGLHYDDVIGVETVTRHGIITDEQKGPITWKEGKAEALLERTQGVQPIFCSGNTMGDAALLESSQLLKLAVSSSGPGHELYETETSLKKLAQEKTWLSHSFK